jgi:restriction system protein
VSPRATVAGVSELPTWRALRSFLEVADGRPQALLSALRVAIRGLRGEGHDFTQPEAWLVSHLSDPERTFGLELWRRSRGALNPRYVRHVASTAKRFVLLENDRGKLTLTDDGRDFLAHLDGRVERALDAAEGVAKLLAVVAQSGSERSAAFLAPFQAWCFENTNMRAEATVRTALHARLANLLDRGLVQCSGDLYGATAAGLARLGDEAESSEQPAPAADP